MPKRYIPHDNRNRLLLPNVLDRELGLVLQVIQQWADRIPGVGKWHYVGATGEPAFENSWVNRGDGTDWTLLRFRREGVDLVRIEGVIVTSENVYTLISSTIFTLPPSFRPSFAHIFSGGSDIPIYQTVDPTLFYVGQDGKVVWSSSSNLNPQGTGVFTSLDYVFSLS